MSNNEKDVWLDIEAKYLAGALPKSLSKEYGLSIRTINQRIRRKGLKKQRDKMSQMCRKISNEEFAKNLAQERIEARKRWIGVTNTLLKDIVGRMAKAKSNREFNQLVKSLEVCMKMVWNTYSITDDETRDSGLTEKKINVNIHTFPEAKGW